LQTTVRTLELIFKGQDKNIRTLKNSGDFEAIKNAKDALWAIVLGIANSYTAANFEQPISESKSIILDNCVELVFNHYAWISSNEIKLAFELAAAGKIEADLSTYYGKFSVDVLGRVLFEYRKFRNKVLTDVNNLSLIEKSRQEDVEKDKKNQETRGFVKQSYLDMLDVYRDFAILDAKKIKPFWAKILLDLGILQFSSEEKSHIWNVAKRMVAFEYLQKIKSTPSPEGRKKIYKALFDIKNKNINSEVDADFKSKYCVLLIVRQIKKSTIK